MTLDQDPEHSPSDMETLISQTSFDCVERYLYQQQQQTDLPVLGNLALDQILLEQQPPKSHLISSPLDMDRMSPDSSMDWTRNNRTAACNGGRVIQTQADSTTHDLPYDSDAFNSDDSNESFVELQLNPNLLQDLQMQHRDDTSSESRSSRSSSFSSSPPPSAESLSEDFDFLRQGDSSIGSASSQEEEKLQEQEQQKRKKKKCKRALDVTLKCERCIYTTRFKEHLSSHMNTHLDDRKFLCPKCAHTFKWSHSLKRHMRTHQPADVQFPCRFCEKAFSRKDHLSIHENLHRATHESFPCPECGVAFKNKKTLAGHVKTHTAEKMFRCKECESEFTRQASLNRHEQTKHKGLIIPCPFCPATFSYKSTLEDHKKAAHNEGRREFECQLCNVQFAVKAYLSKHMVTCRNRADGKSFSCDVCPKRFPTKRHLNEHSKRKHPDVEAKELLVGSDQRLHQHYEQQQQQMSYHHHHHLHQEQQMDQHRHYQHDHQQQQFQQQQQQLPPLPAFQQFGYACDLCHASFAHDNELDSHLMGHLPPQQVQQHQQNHHMGAVATTSISTASPSSPVVVVTGNDLTLPQIQEQGEGEENVGSLLRLAYSCSSSSSVSSVAPVSSSIVVQDCRSSYISLGDMSVVGRSGMYQVDHRGHQADSLIDYQILEGLPIDCL